MRGLLALSIVCGFIGCSAQDDPGERIVYLSQAGGKSALISIDPQGEDSRDLVARTADSPFHWSSREPRVIYTATGQQGKAGIFGVPVMGGQPVAIVDGDEGRISPDARQMVFGAGEMRQLKLFDMMTAEVKDLKGANGYAPRWSPESLYIAYQSWPRDAGYLYLQSRHGNRKVQLTRHTANGAQWSPDGTALVYSRSGGEAAGLYLVYLDGASVRLTYHKARDPQWSPDGQTIAYQREGDERSVNGAIYVVGIGEDPKPLTGHAGMRPQWSPSGASLVYTRASDKSLCRVEVAGGPSIKLADGPADYAQWSGPGRATKAVAGSKSPAVPGSSSPTDPPPTPDGSDDF